jgi:hypothetical protein
MEGWACTTEWAPRHWEQLRLMLGSSTVDGDSSISDRAHHENWTSHQHIGAIAQDSININSKIEHNYVSNT